MSTDILDAILQRLYAFAWSPELPIMWPAKNEEPPDTGMWLEPGFFPNEPIDEAWDDGCLISLGFGQVLVSGRPNDPLVAPGGQLSRFYEVADALVDWFPKSMVLGPVRVRKTPWSSPHIVEGEGSRISVPVTIPFMT